MRIALFGLGIIGDIWSRHWLADGHEIQAWNRTPKPTHPCYRDDAPGMASTAQLVSLVVADGQAVNAVLDDILAVLAPGCVVANHATIGVDETLATAARVQAAGHAFLDMPFTGSKIASEQRQVVWFIGGQAETFSRVKDVYQPLAKALVPVGDIGQAMTIKLALNQLIAGTYQALAESHRLARAAGISEQDFARCLDLNVARSGLVDLKLGKLAAQDWSPQFSVKHLLKDLRHADRLAAGQGLQLPMAQALVALYQQALEAGQGDQDFSSVATLLQ